MTHCREEGRAAYRLLWRTKNLMNPGDVQIEPCSITTWLWWKRTCMPVSVQVCLFEVVSSCCTALGGKCLTLTFPHIHSILKDQPGYTRKALSSSTCNKSGPVAELLLMMGWWLRGKFLLGSPAETSGPTCKILEPGQHGSANEHLEKDSHQPTNPEQDKKQSWRWKHKALMWRLWNSSDTYLSVWLYNLLQDTLLSDWIRIV